MPLLVGKNGLRVIAFLLLYLSCLSGCIFPVHLADDEPFREEDIPPLIVGSTTKTEVLDLLGEPEASFQNGQWWVYNEDRKMTEWLVIMCAGYGACGGDTFGGDVRQYSLILEFDNELFKALYVVKEDDPCGPDNSVCLVDVLLEIPDISSVDIQVPDDHCLVAIFSNKPSSPLTAVYIRMSALEGRPIRFLSDTSVLYLHVPIGANRISVKANLLEGEFSAVEYLECASGQTYFFEFSHPQMHQASFSMVEESRGRQEIEKRRLAIPPDRRIPGIDGFGRKDLENMIIN